MTARGVLLVAGQEFRVRLRTGRWRWLLGAWVATVALFTLLLTLALDGTQDPHGVPLFGGLMLFVLGLVLVVTPSLTAQSINGDRERGTLAALQVTRLSASEIALGKLLASWGVGLGALALTLPFVGWAMAEGGVTVGQVAVVLIVVSLLIGVVCAVSQALSALLARSITSALLSYVTVFALTVGTMIAFVFAGVLAGDGNGRSRPDRVWWILAPNPFVVLADATPRLPPVYGYKGDYVPQPADPLGEIGRAARDLRRPPNDYPDYSSHVDDPDPAPLWPYGLGFDLLLGAGAVAVTIQRLRTPVRRMAKGVRIA
jgi:ABC-type transport system involved in multi-copper enzyme maturation permease subunit